MILDNLKPFRNRNNCLDNLIVNSASNRNMVYNFLVCCMYAYTCRPLSLCANVACNAMQARCMYSMHHNIHMYAS